MTPRVLTVEQREWLEAELAAWETEGVITAAIRQQILTRYESPVDVSLRRRSLAILTLLALAGVVLGLSVLMAVAYNWDALRRAGKLAILFVGLVLSHGIAYSIRYRSAYRRLAEVAYLVACLIYGAAIWQIGAVGAVFLMLAELHRRDHLFGEPYRIIGTLIVGGTLIPLSYYRLTAEFIRDRAERGGFVETILILVAALVTLTGLLLVRRRETLADKGDVRREIYDLIEREWIPLGMIAAMTFCSIWTRIYAGSVGAANAFGAAILPTIVANATMLTLTLWLVSVGLREDRLRPFAAGVGYFLLWTCLRYFDLFGDFGGMLGAAGLFFVCAMVLLGVAMYWMQRKEIHRD